MLDCWLPDVPLSSVPWPDPLEKIADFVHPQAWGLPAVLKILRRGALGESEPLKVGTAPDPQPEILDPLLGQTGPVISGSLREQHLLHFRVIETDDYLVMQHPDLASCPVALAFRPCRVSYIPTGSVPYRDSKLASCSTANLALAQASPFEIFRCRPLGTTWREPG